MKYETAVRRFHEKIDRSSPDGCWPWTGKVYSTGYGAVVFQGKETTAHRLVLELDGALPLGTYALHRCDNPACCRRDHLYAGTQRENIRDAVERRRFPRRDGEHSPVVRLTDAQVQEIRESADSNLSLAIRFGVTRQHIGSIRNGASRVPTEYAMRFT